MDDGMQRDDETGSTIGRGHVDQMAFTAAMGAAATGVTVVTTNGPAGRFGLTVSALASVSAEPPMLLVCVNRRNPSVAAITHHGRFAVNILSEAQEDVARVFAGRPISGAPYDFSAHNWETTASGMLLLKGASAAFICETESIHDAGTHRIFIGRVTHAARGGVRPLIYNGRSFGRFAAFQGDNDDQNR